MFLNNKLRCRYLVCFLGKPVESPIGSSFLYFSRSFCEICSRIFLKSTYLLCIAKYTETLFFQIAKKLLCTSPLGLITSEIVPFRFVSAPQNQGIWFITCSGEVRSVHASHHCSFTPIEEEHWLVGNHLHALEKMVGYYFRENLRIYFPSSPGILYQHYLAKFCCAVITCLRR